MILIDTELCEGCGDCEAFCPHDCIGLVAEQGRVVAVVELPDDCAQCGICEDCHVGAISLVREGSSNEN